MRQEDDIGRGAADKDALSEPAVRLGELGGPSKIYPVIAQFLAENAKEGGRVQVRFVCLTLRRIQRETIATCA